MARSSASKRRRAIALATLATLAMIGTLATIIVRAQDESRSRIAQSLRLRTAASAQLVTTYLDQQAERQRRTAEQLLSTPLVSADRFDSVVSAFGSRAAVLLDSTGHVIDAAPRNRAIIGREIASGYEHLRDAEANKTAISGAVPSAVTGESVTAVAVPFQTALAGRRVFSVAYRTGGPALQAFVDHAIAYPEHDVALIDASGHLLADSPRSDADTLAREDPALASALGHGGFGAVPEARVKSTFTVAPVPGTPWRLVVMVPDSRLYSSIGGLAQTVPWVFFALVSLLAAVLLVLFSRLLDDRIRLSDLSAELEAIARTDPLTGLSNRRAIEGDLTRIFARARRHSEPTTVMMIDLDRFKQINDSFGHEAGDRVLVAVARCLRETIRVEDVYGRVGGDEFVVVISDTDEDAGRAVAARLEACAATVRMPDIGLDDGIAMSVGVAAGVHTTPDELMRAADEDLYRVKNARRAGARGGAPAGASL